MREFKASTMPECKKRARKRALQKACATRKTYALDTAWWRENYCVKLAKTTSCIQYRLIQQSPASPPCHRYIALAHIAYGGLGGHPCESCPEAVGKRALPPYTRAFPPRAPPCMSRCLSSCVAVSAKQSTIIIHTSVRAEDCSRSSAGARKRGAPRSTGNPVGENPTWARGSSPT